MIEQVIRTLLHPRMTMASLSLLSVYAGVTTLAYDGAFLHVPVVWATVALVAGIIGMLTVWFPRRSFVAASGSLLVVAGLARAVALIESSLTLELPRSVQASYGISAAQFLTLSYITFVIWKRQVIPWSILEVEDRSDGP